MLITFSRLLLTSFELVLSIASSAIKNLALTKCFNHREIWMFNHFTQYSNSKMFAVSDIAYSNSAGVVWETHKWFLSFRMSVTLLCNLTPNYWHFVVFFGVFLITTLLIAAKSHEFSRFFLRH